ncbi:MAG TPA: metallophosphoesterase [Actinomycetota bacterium]|nr:metallophosphoesterase [Actinomycetota bacterium]
MLNDSARNYSGTLRMLLVGAVVLTVAVVAMTFLRHAGDDPTLPAGAEREGGAEDPLGVGGPLAQTPSSPTPTPSAPGSTPSPVPSADLSFAVIGDFGTGLTDQQEIAERMCSWRRDRPFDTVITTGDNIYPDGDPELFDPNFFDPYRCLLSRGVEWHASLGNHDIITDGGQPELEEPAFGMRGHNYVVRSGGVRFVIADSNVLDREWLARATRARATDRWTVVAFHHPVFSPGDAHGSTPGFRPGLPRLFARRGVDLVVNGHDHLYAVSKLRRGVRYVVTGGGGAALYGCTEQDFSEVCVEAHHFLWVRATTASIRVWAIPATGPPFHKLTIADR